MFRYELLMLVVPEITKDEASAIETQLEKVVAQKEGSVLSFERWGKYKLAYPIRHNEYGIYYLMRFEVPNKETITQEIRSLLAVRFDTTVMRFVVTALDPKQPLTYQRPLSLEEAPAKTAGSFLREKGLMSDEGFERRSGRFNNTTQDTDVEQFDENSINA